MNQKAALHGNNPVAIRFHELPIGYPGHFTQAELMRAANLRGAEAARAQAEAYALDVIVQVFELHPDAANAGEALRLAGLEKEFDRRMAAAPGADEVGMRWFIDEVERSIALGTFVVIGAKD